MAYFPRDTTHTGPGALRSAAHEVPVAVHCSGAQGLRGSGAQGQDCLPYIDT